RAQKGRVLRPVVGTHGYPLVDLRRDGERSMRTVHALVLEAFVGPRPTSTEACHANGDRTDARLANLRWDTHSANVQDTLRHGTHSEARKTSCPFGHALVAPNLVPSHHGRACLACSRARAY